MTHRRPKRHRSELMTVNRRTWTLLIVAVAVIGGVYAITLWQRSRETRRLMEDLQSPDHAVAAQAMISLRDRVPAVSDRLIQLAQQAGGPVRWRAIVLLGEIEGEASRDVLIDALQASDPTMKAAAARALAERGVRGAADRVAMLATATEEPMEVRLAAVRALQEFRTGTHLAEMSRLATDRPPPPPEEPEAEEAEAAAEAPAEEPTGEAAAEVAEAAAEEQAAEEAEPAEEAEEWSDETVDLRIEAVRAVAILGAAGVESDAGESSAMEAARVLAEASGPEEHNDEVRQAACYALMDLTALEMSEDVRVAAVEALLNAADDEIGDVRIAAIYGLSQIPTPADLRDRVDQAMNDALNDDHYWVRVAAGEEPIGG